MLPEDRFNNREWIERRAAETPYEVRGVLRTILSYLYLEDGPRNLQNPRFKPAESLLEPRERMVARWLKTRTNGNLRKKYGAGTLAAARRAKFRCEDCGHADVRTLVMDHVEGRKAVTSTFRCLCANCHQIKSREEDWQAPRPTH